jgi:hypothetical protein
VFVYIVTASELELISCADILVRRKTVNLMWEKKVKLSHRKSWKIR